MATHSVLNATPLAEDSSHFIHRLPGELLALVMVQSIPDDSPRIIDHPAISLSHVCRHWRFIAVGTPRLWSRFRFSIGRRGFAFAKRDQQQHPNPQALGLFLHRSGSCGLNLTTYLDPEKHNDAASLAQFLSVSHRWLHIELTCPCDTDELDSIGGHIPMLRSLFLQEFENGALPRPLHAFTLAPSLRSVALEQRRMSSWISHHNPDNRSLATLRIPVHQLTSLTMNHGDRWHLLPDLAGVRNLLILINPSLTPSSSTPPIRCESLHTLSISAIGDTSYSKLVLPTPLDSLEAPNLGKLANYQPGRVQPGRPEPKVGADILRVDITLCNRHISAEELALFRVLKTDGMNLSFRGQKDSKAGRADDLIAFRDHYLFVYPPLFILLAANMRAHDCVIVQMWNERTMPIKLAIRSLALWVGYLSLEPAQVQVAHSSSLHHKLLPAFDSFSMSSPAAISATCLVDEVSIGLANMLVSVEREDCHSTDAGDTLTSQAEDYLAPEEHSCGCDSVAVGQFSYRGAQSRHTML
ncbi:hypothetical protein C8J57DRAFT_1464347 [Mycena rebaudengoi]|nr:hypothetical protein C8J57DRAFT_1464347 [Mycena rebaudengoi]